MDVKRDEYDHIRTMDGILCIPQIELSSSEPEARDYPCIEPYSSALSDSVTYGSERPGSPSHLYHILPRTDCYAQLHPECGTGTSIPSRMCSYTPEDVFRRGTQRAVVHREPSVQTSEYCNLLRPAVLALPPFRLYRGACNAGLWAPFSPLSAGPVVHLCAVSRNIDPTG